MDDLFVLAVLLYLTGVITALSARGNFLKGARIFCVIILLLCILFFMSLLGDSAGIGVSGGLAGIGVAYMAIFGGIFCLPALGFVVGWFAKLLLPKDVEFLSLLNYIAMAIVILGPVLLYYARVLHPEIKRKSENRLASQEMRRQSEMRRKSEMNFFKNTKVPVKFADNLLVLPVRRDVNFGYYNFERLKAKILEGPIQTNRLYIRGYKSRYYPHSSVSKNSKNTPAECLPVENEKSFRCDFIKPVFSLAFIDASNHKYSRRDPIPESIRKIEEFEIVKEEWRKSKTKNETPRHSLFTLRDFSKDESSGLEIPNFTNCSSYGRDYKCTARINSINGKPQIQYEFNVREAADIPMIIRRTRNIANEYWTGLVENHGIKEIDGQ